MVNPKFSTVSSKLIHKGARLAFYSEEVEVNGHRFTFDKVAHPGAVVILPQDSDGRILVVRQHRQAFGFEMLEFPAGALDHQDEPVAACAARELAEEIGKAASEWIDLGILHPAPGFCDEVQYCFIAKGLSDYREKADEDEFIEVIAMTVADVESSIAAGTMNDAKSIAVFCRARLRGLI